MKPKDELESDSSLDQVLGQWVVDVPLPSRFQEQVWQRIARTQERPAQSIRGLLISLLEVVVPQPQFAFSYLAALLILGVAAGSWAAQRQNERFDALLSGRYLQSINPYQTPAPQ